MSDATCMTYPDNIEPGPAVREYKAYRDHALCHHSSYATPRGFADAGNAAIAEEATGRKQAEDERDHGTKVLKKRLRELASQRERAEQADAALATCESQKRGLAAAAKTGLVAGNRVVELENELQDYQTQFEFELSARKQAEAEVARLTPFSDRAKRNVEKWGLQDFETLGLAVCEEAGELAQAILQEKHEGGSRERITDEAIDLGALCIQVADLAACHKARDD